MFDLEYAAWDIGTATGITPAALSLVIWALRTESNRRLNSFTSWYWVETLAFKLAAIAEVLATSDLAKNRTTRESSKVFRLFRLMGFRYFLSSASSPNRKWSMTCLVDLFKM